MPLSFCYSPKCHSGVYVEIHMMVQLISPNALSFWGLRKVCVCLRAFGEIMKTPRGINRRAFGELSRHIPRDAYNNFVVNQFSWNFIMELMDSLLLMC